MDNFKTFLEDLASGRPAKKPVSSNLLKQRAKDNEKALKSGFMKLTPKERAKEEEERKDLRNKTLPNEGLLRILSNPKYEGVL